LRPREEVAIVLVIGGPITGADLPGLCERVRVLLEASDVDLVTCDVGAVADPDAGTVDALARLQLTAGRLGCQVAFRNASCELLELLDLTGLRDIVPLCTELRLGSRRQAEEREQARGVEEEVEPDDPTG